METGIEKATDLYAAAREVTNLADCSLYHTMDIPGYGLVTGDWDLRSHVGTYLAGIDFAGKRVLGLRTPTVT